MVIIYEDSRQLSQPFPPFSSPRPPWLLSYQPPWRATYVQIECGKSQIPQALSLLRATKNIAKDTTDLRVKCFCLHNNNRLKASLVPYVVKQFQYVVILSKFPFHAFVILSAVIS